MTDLDKPDHVKSTEFTLHSGSSQLRLRFEPDAFTTLGREISAGNGTGPKDPAETGGLLTGEIVQNNSDWIVTIQDVTAVGIQYRFGPCYRPSAADREVFRRHLTRKKVFCYLAPDQKPGGYPIGWYRSNTRPLPEPEEDDREMSRTFFGSDRNIFLLCDLSPDGRVHATCIIMQTNGTETAFPFDLGRFTDREDPGKSRYEEIERAGNEDTRPFEKPPTSPPRALKVEPVPSSPEFISLDDPGALRREQPAFDDRRSFKPHVTSSPMPPPSQPAGWPLQVRTPPYSVSGANLRFAAAIVAAGAIAYYARGRVPPTPAAALAVAKAAPESPVAVVQAADSNGGDALGLRAEYQGHSLLLGWDRTSARVNAATSGVFIITDGSKTRVLTLSPRELRNGGILYKHSADDINVELQIIEPQGRTASQSIRIVGGPDAVSPAEPIKQIARSVLQKPAVPRSDARELRVARFEAPPEVAAEQRSITTVDAPLIDPQVTMPPPWFASALMPPPPQAAPPRASTPAKADGDAAAHAGAAPEFAAATPIHSPQPFIPQGLSFPQYAYDHGVEVKVEVNINAAGRVSNTRIVGAAGPYASQLGPYAMNAARGWTFHPAMLGGQPIASTMVLTFRFSRPQ